MLGSPFDCDICGEFGFCEYDVKFFDLTTAELCEDCLERERKANRVITATRFVGLPEKI